MLHLVFSPGSITPDGARGVWLCCWHAQAPDVCYTCYNPRNKLAAMRASRHTPSSSQIDRIWKKHRMEGYICKDTLVRNSTLAVFPSCRSYLSEKMTVRVSHVPYLYDSIYTCAHIHTHVAGFVAMLAWFPSSALAACTGCVFIYIHSDKQT